MNFGKFIHVLFYFGDTYWKTLKNVEFAQECFQNEIWSKTLVKNSNNYFLSDNICWKKNMKCILNSWMEWEPFVATYTSLYFCLFYILIIPCFTAPLYLNMHPCHNIYWKIWQILLAWVKLSSRCSRLPFSKVIPLFKTHIAPFFLY